MKKIALAVLAAGASRRFGEASKLLANWNGRPLIAHSLHTFESAPFTKRIAIIPEDSVDLQRICRDFNFSTLVNENAGKGIATSIALAASQAGDADGVMIALADMPSVKSETVETVIVEATRAADDAIVTPVYNNRRGHPVIFGSAYFPQLAALTGDKGAAGLIRQCAENVISVPVEDEGILIDFDVPSDFVDS